MDIDGERVWPPADPPHGLPPSRVATLRPHEPTRMAFGSCRTSVPHDEETNAKFGIDALRAYALHMAGLTGDPDAGPDLGSSSATRSTPTRPAEEMQEFIASRRDLDEPPWTS